MTFLVRLKEPFVWVWLESFELLLLAVGIDDVDDADDDTDIDDDGVAAPSVAVAD